MGPFTHKANTPFMHESEDGLKGMLVHMNINNAEFTKSLSQSLSQSLSVTFFTAKLHRASFKATFHPNDKTSLACLSGQIILLLFVQVSRYHSLSLWCLYHWKIIQQQHLSRNCVSLLTLSTVVMGTHSSTVL